MKSLLQDCLKMLEASEWDDLDHCQGCNGRSYQSVNGIGEIREAGHLPGCTWESCVTRLRAAIAAHSPDPDPASAILCLCDSLEDKGDWRATIIRSVMCDEPKIADVITALQLASEPLIQRAAIMANEQLAR